VASPDITENIPLNVGNPGTTGFWTNNAEDYDVAVGGMPFFLAPTDNEPYQRETAPYRKDQFDNGKEPGEQSLTGWWIRSQSSFHVGQGIKFYDPSTGETTPYRFTDSRGVNVWTKGQATLLKDVTAVNHPVTDSVVSASYDSQHLRTIKWGTTDGVLLHDGYDVDKIAADGTVTNFVDYNTGADTKVYAICDDGTYAYWVTNITNKMYLYKKLLTDDYSVGETEMFHHATDAIVSAEMEFVKDRIVLCFNNKVYEISPTATALPATPIYTNPNTNYKYTSVSASGSAIYTAGYSGLYSTIQKYVLSTTSGSVGEMTKLSQASTAAELPAGEIVHKLYSYLNYMLIGTSKGIRVAIVDNQDGSIGYGPLIVETNQPVYDFAARDRFVWCTTGIDSTDGGLIRIDLGQSIENEPLRFAYAYDLQYTQSIKYPTTAVAFIGETNRLAFTTSALNAGTNVTNKALTSNVATLTTSIAHGLIAGDSIWVEGVGSPFDSTTAPFTVVNIPTTTTFTYAKTNADIASTAVSSSFAKVNKPGKIVFEEASALVSTGYITSGAIRYGTLEPKHFKFIRARGDYTNGALDIAIISDDGLVYNVITYNSVTGSPEAATTSPENSHEFVSYKFTLSRSATDTSLGPIFKGYQAKALPATKRQRLIQFPVWCFDVETDRYNVKTGYDGRAWERIETLENLEAIGDIVNIQDFTTGERVQGVIEKVGFSRKTPPSGNFSGFGGVLLITVRTVL
jgi:hypothetical protein